MNHIAHDDKSLLYAIPAKAFIWRMNFIGSKAKAKKAYLCLAYSLKLRDDRDRGPFKDKLGGLVVYGLQALRKRFNKRGVWTCAHRFSIAIINSTAHSEAW